VQRQCLKLQVDNLSVLFKFQEAVTRKPCFKKPVFIHILVLWCRCTACRFGRAFLLHSEYSSPVTRMQGEKRSQYKNTKNCVNMRQSSETWKRH
jgi:hypothetical protein